MTNKGALNAEIQQLTSEAAYWKVRYNGALEKIAILHKRLAQRRNGFFRRLWLRWRAFWHA